MQEVVAKFSQHQPSAPKPTLQASCWVEAVQYQIINPKDALGALKNFPNTQNMKRKREKRVLGKCFNTPQHV